MLYACNLYILSRQSVKINSFLHSTLQNLIAIYCVWDRLMSFTFLLWKWALFILNSATLDTELSKKVSHCTVLSIYLTYFCEILPFLCFLWTDDRPYAKNRAFMWPPTHIARGNITKTLRNISNTNSYGHLDVLSYWNGLCIYVVNRVIWAAQKGNFNIQTCLKLYGKFISKNQRSIEDLRRLNAIWTHKSLQN